MNSTYYDESSTSSNSMVKVFAWLFFAILLTAVTAVGLPYLLVALNAQSAYLPIFYGGLIATIVLSIVSQLIIARAKSKAMAITFYSLFAVAMGIWISPLVLIYDTGTLVYSMFVTAGIFGVMALYGTITKRDLSGFGSFLFMLLFGAIIISIFNLFFANSTLDWILGYVVLGIYIGFIAFDIQRIKRLADAGQLNLNSSLLVAMNLYVDIIYIFIRIVGLIGSSRRN